MALEHVERMAVPDERGTLCNMRVQLDSLATMRLSPFGLSAFSAARAELQEWARGGLADLPTLAQRLASAAAIGDAAQVGAEMAAAALHMQATATIETHLTALRSKPGEPGVQVQLDKWQARQLQLGPSLDELLSASRPVIGESPGWLGGGGRGLRASHVAGCTQPTRSHLKRNARPAASRRLPAGLARGLLAAHHA